MKTWIFQLETRYVCLKLFTFVNKMKIVSDERVFKPYLRLLDWLFRTHLNRSFHGNLPQPTLRIVSKLDSTTYSELQYIQNVTYLPRFSQIFVCYLTSLCLEILLISKVHICITHHFYMYLIFCNMYPTKPQ